MKNTITRWMRQELASNGAAYLDSADCPMFTHLAETAADAFERHDWLDDPDHWVWDIAIDAFDTIPHNN